jgi:hypothetical protein
MDDIAEELGRSPELFPYVLDLPADGVLFTRLRKTDFETASFLDARLITPQTASRMLPWPEVSAAIDAARLAERCGFIFHIGHVGSTLLSRLIGSHAAVFSLREPEILRTLAQLDGAVAPSWRNGDFWLLSMDLICTAIPRRPVGRVMYGASSKICVPVSLARKGPALGAQAGEAKLREVVVGGGGFGNFRRATQTPFNLVLEARA